MMELQDALTTLRTLLDLAIEKGLFNSAEVVANVINAFNVVHTEATKNIEVKAGNEQNN